MTKLKRIIILILIWLLAGFSSYSQYYVKFKGDSIGFEKDSVVLALDNIISENLIWEISKDSVTWESLNKTNDTLAIRIDNNYFYRAVLSEGTCYPVNSDVAFAGFKSIEVSGNSVLIDSTGGVYILPSGIKLAVPPKAVTESVTVSLDLLDSLNAETQIPFDADIGKMFCAAIQCESIQFLKPVKISIPAPNIQHNDLPYVYQFNDATGFWEKCTDKLVFSEKMQIVEFSSHNLASTRIQLFKVLFAFDNVVKHVSPEDTCKEGFIDVVSDDHDSQGQIGSKECYVSSSKISVRFLECPGSPVNTAKIQEIGKDCEPLLEDNVKEIKCLKKDESATINVKVTIGGLPLKDQHIEFFELPDGLSIDKTESFTNAAGEEQFEVTCNKENFSGTIKYRVTYVYYLEIANASGGGVSQIKENYQKTGQIPEEHLIEECPKLSSIELTNANVMLLEQDSSIQLICRCLDQYGNDVDCENVEYEVMSWGEYPFAGVSINETGMLTTSSGGVVSLKVRSGGVESQKTKIATVEYIGSMPDLQLTSDHNTYKLCGCQEDYDNPPHKWQWWVVKYTGGLEISMYLNPDINLLPIAMLTGAGTITYSIGETSRCSGATFTETIQSHSAGWLLVPSENPGSGPFSMEDLIKGKKCIVEFEYEDFRQFYWHVLRGTVQLSTNGFEFSILDWRPDDCIHRDVEGSCILK